MSWHSTTIQYHNQSKTYSDNVLKVFAIHPNTAIAFVGDIKLADHLLSKLFFGLKNRTRKDPISLSKWLPRLFRHEYKKIVTCGDMRDVIFMVASVIKDRPNIVDRVDVEKLINYIISGKSPIKRNHIPRFLIEILQLPRRIERVPLLGTCRGVLYVLESPSFKVRAFRPMQFAAIGSGETALEEVINYQDSILALDPGNSFLEGEQFRWVIQRFISEKNIKSVGGLFPVLKVTGRGVEHITMGTEIPLGGTRIELAFENGRWIQKNQTTGKQIPILMPWEAIKENFTKNQKFDDLNEAYKKFKKKD